MSYASDYDKILYALFLERYESIVKPEAERKRPKPKKVQRDEGHRVDHSRR